jgi:DNA-binding FadR family transcriptional regulator
MKTDTVFKRAYNDTLDLFSGLHRGETIPTEVQLGQKLGVSRTTIRKVLSALESRGVVVTG